MRSMKQLVRLHRWKLNEKRQKLAELEDLAAKMHLEVDRLDKKSTEILIYHFFDDMTQEEISDLMKLSRKTVGKRLGKIRDQVRELALNGGAA